jgi:uncharacterized protein (TIGR00730 family)
MSEKEIKDNIDQHIDKITSEFKNGFEFIKKHPKIVTVFGSARESATAPYYESIRALTNELVKQFGVTIATGGGPGVMQAANHGAYDADPKKSIAMAIELPHEQMVNPYISEYEMFRFFFTRKVIMTYSTDAFIVCPGGFGTFDELFEMLTLQQTRKAVSAPVILFGTDFWAPIYDFIVTSMQEKGFIDARDEELFIMTDSVDDIVTILKRLEI